MHRRGFVAVAAFLMTAGIAQAQQADGPPSEQFANALRHYQGERYAEAGALFEQVAGGRTSDAPASRQRAEFFLSKTHYHLRRYPEALRGFARIAQAGPDHLYFGQTLQWLLQLSGYVPVETPGLIEGIGRYDEPDIARLDTPESRDFHARAVYLMGRARAAGQRYPEALRLFERVREGTPDSAEAARWAQRMRATIGPQ